MQEDQKNKKEKEILKTAIRSLILIAVFNYLKDKWNKSHISDKYILISLLILGCCGFYLDSYYKTSLNDIKNLTNILIMGVVEICFFIPYIYLRFFSKKHRKFESSKSIPIIIIIVILTGIINYRLITI